LIRRGARYIRARAIFLWGKTSPGINQDYVPPSLAEEGNLSSCKGETLFLNVETLLCPNGVEGDEEGEKAGVSLYWTGP